MIFQEIGRQDTHWIDVARDMDRWHALVNAVMTLHVPENVGNFLTN